MMIVVAIMGFALAAYGELASHAAQREKEEELLFRGEAYRHAIEQYYNKGHSYPTSLADLLDDRRGSKVVRHLRALYPDPMTGQKEWGLVQDEQGGIHGVYSRAETEPLRKSGFADTQTGFAEAKTYLDWKFTYTGP